MPQRSPFPGLDPFLEAHWGDVHHSLVQYTRDALQDGLPDDLFVRAEERVYLQDEEFRVRSFGPDTRIVEWHRGNSAGEPERSDAGIAIAEPQILVFDEDETTEGYLEIREADGGRVITVIEFLSPANKVGGRGTQLYRQKQTEVLNSTSSLVEIDLVRAGRRVLCVAENAFPHQWRNCAQATIWRSWRRTNREIYGFPLREKLKALPIPLRSHEKPILLDLQAILDQCYAKGRYDRIDYTKPLDPPLAAEDAEWAHHLLVNAGKR